MRCTMLTKSKQDKWCRKTHLTHKEKTTDPRVEPPGQHPALYPTDLKAAGCLSSMMTAYDHHILGWPRPGVCNPWFRRESLHDRARSVYICTHDGAPPRGHDVARPRVARFPGWPHGNRTHNGSTSVARKARTRTYGGPPPARAFCVPLSGPLRSVRARARARSIRGPFIGDPRDLLSRLPLHLPVYRCLSIISVPPANFERQFDYGCHPRRTRDFGVHSHASLTRDRTSHLAEEHEERRASGSHRVRGPDWIDEAPHFFLVFPFCSSRQLRGEKQPARKELEESHPLRGKRDTFFFHSL